MMMIKTINWWSNCGWWQRRERRGQSLEKNKNREKLLSWLNFTSHSTKKKFKSFNLGAARWYIHFVNVDLKTEVLSRNLIVDVYHTRRLCVIDSDIWFSKSFHFIWTVICLPGRLGIGRRELIRCLTIFHRRTHFDFHPSPNCLSVTKSLRCFCCVPESDHIW